LFQSAPDAYAVVLFNMDGSQSDYKGYAAVAEADDAYGKVTDNPAPWAYAFEADRTIGDASDPDNEYLRNEAYFVATDIQSRTVVKEVPQAASPPMQGGLTMDAVAPHINAPAAIASQTQSKSGGGGIWGWLLGLVAVGGLGYAIAKRKR
jgi:hypothetical protein